MKRYHIYALYKSQLIKLKGGHKNPSGYEILFPSAGYNTLIEAQKELASFMSNFILKTNVIASLYYPFGFDKKTQFVILDRIEQKIKNMTL